MGKILTISVAAYNVESFVLDTLESCSKGDMDKYEVIVVDDGSTDRTREIVRDYCKKAPETFKIISKENGGYGSTINTGIANAVGKYFMVLDGDDTLDASGFNELLYTLENTDSDLVITQFVEEYTDTSCEKVCDTLPLVSDGVHSLDSFAKELKVALHAFAYKTSLLKKSGFRVSEHCFYTDTEMALVPLMWVDSVTVKHFPVYRYKLGLPGQSVSIEGRRRHYKDCIAVFNNLLSFYNQFEFQSANKKELYEKNLAFTADCCYENMFLLPPSKGHKAELVEFDKKLSAYDKLYNSPVYQRKIRLFRQSAYFAYWVCCLRAIQTYRS